jgi:hypothetical protein
MLHSFKRRERERKKKLKRSGKKNLTFILFQQIDFKNNKKKSKYTLNIKEFFKDNKRELTFKFIFYCSAELKKTQGEFE